MPAEPSVDRDFMMDLLFVLDEVLRAQASARRTGRARSGARR
jgi:hypothetical protein